MATLWLTSCASSGPVNTPLTGKSTNAEPHDFSKPELADHPVILAAFSGGGSRAAALGLSVLQELGRYGYKKNQTDYRLTDDIKAVSSVSGGSVAAAYFVLKYPGPIDDLRAKFLEQDNMAALEWEAAFPVTWFRLVFTKYTRVEAMQDLLAERLFGQANFAAVNRPVKPLLILNATDMASGQVFTFTSDMFDTLCSDLDAMPLSAAVAASADFPVALSPMTIENFSKNCAAKPAVPGWVDYDLTPASLARDLDLDEFRRAQYIAALRHLDSARQPADPANSPYRDIEYIHLLDGGVADNVGAHSLIPLFTKNYAAGHLFDAIQKGYAKRLVILTINARGEVPSSLDTDATTPGMITSVGSITRVPIEATTAAVNALVHEADFAIAEQRLLAPPDANIRRLEVYDIGIDFDQLPDSEKALRGRVKEIPTSWNLTSAELDDIDQAARILLDQQPCFQKLLSDMGISATFIDQHRAAFCTTR